MAKIHLEIVTPDKRAYTDDVDGVVIPGSEGEFGVLPNHAPLLTMVVPGELKVTRDGRVDYLVVGEGFVEVTGTSVTVLTDLAVAESQIDETTVEQALRRAEEALKSVDHSAEQAEVLTATIKKSLAQLNLKRRRHP